MAELSSANNISLAKQKFGNVTKIKLNFFFASSN